MINLMRNEGPGIYGLTGGAGAGKTTLAGNIERAFGDITVYSADYRFIGDGGARKDLLRFKQNASISAYLDAANQYNWWDWEAIEKDLKDLSSGTGVCITAPYNRDTGIFVNDIIIPSKPYILFEGNNMGSPGIIDALNSIFVLHTPPEVRFSRLFHKDVGRRTFKEIMARFLVTDYSEGLSYRLLTKWYSDKTHCVDSQGTLIRFPIDWPEQTSFIPLQIGGG